MEGNHDICGMLEGLLRGHDEGLLVERNLRRALGSHDAVELVGGTFPAGDYPSQYHLEQNDGMELPHQ